MLSRLKPDSARAAALVHTAARAASGASFARIIVNVPYSARPPAARRKSPQNCKPAPPRPLRALGPGGRLIDAADEALQAMRQSTPLRFREKAAQLALPAVRLDGEPARVQTCGGAAQFNLRPMPREHDPRPHGPRGRFDADFALGDDDGLAVEAPLERCVQRPAEQRELQPRERQHRPEAAPGEER